MKIALFSTSSGAQTFDKNLQIIIITRFVFVPTYLHAGRPQFDESGVASVLVHDVKKHFYKKFLYEPFPVESSLHNVLPDHLNAEVVAGMIQSRQEALDYLTWTYFFR